MFLAMLIGGMMARDAFPTAMKHKYGVDLTKLTAGQRKFLFAPMNRDRTFEPLVFATRLNVIDDIPDKE